MTTQCSRIWLACLSLFIALGCSGKPPVAEVEGTLTWNGTPLPGIVVQFLPDADQGTTGASSQGVTDQNGHFVLMSDDQRPGAVIGHHRVVLLDSGDPGDKARQRDPRHSSGDGSAAPKNLVTIPNNYKSPSTTPLKREVVADKQTLDLKLP